MSVRIGLEGPYLEYCEIHKLEKRQDTGKSWRCKKCASSAVRKNRRATSEKLKNLHGGCCVICGYNRCLRALHFHHIDPATKEFQIGGIGQTFSWARKVQEAKKCILVCSNCHAEIHDGLVEIPE